MRYTTESWIAEAKKRYADKYVYDTTEYIDSYHKVFVQCSQHGTLIEVPSIQFIRGKEKEYCPKCEPIIASIEEPEIKENVQNLFEKILLELKDKNYLLKHSEVKDFREFLLKKQNNICPLCANKIEATVLDHYHSQRQHGSGLVRGVICNTCNRMTGVIENNFARNSIDYSDGPEFLRRLADYLLNARYPFLYPTEKDKPPELSKKSYNKLLKAVNGKQKVPSYNKKLTKALEKLFNKYNIEPEFNKQ